MVSLIEQEGSGPFVAKSLLLLMVRGTLFNLTFHYAHFTSEGITADLLFPIVWEAVRRLECNEIKVISVTADGASPNRKFFRLHGIPGDSSITRHRIRTSLFGAHLLLGACLILVSTLLYTRYLAPTI